MKTAEKWWLQCAILTMSLFFVTSAQGQTATPTHTPAPATATAAPTFTPQPDPALAGIMNNLPAINAANVLDIQEIYQWSAHEARVTSLLFIAPEHLVSTAQNGSNRTPAIRVWDITAGGINPEGRVFEDAVASAVNIPHVQLSENGRVLAAAHSGATVWDVLTRHRIGNISAPASSVFQFGTNYVLAGSSSGLVSLWWFDLPYGDYRETGILPEDYIYQPRPSQLITAFRVDDAVIQVAHADNISFVLTRSGTLLLYSFGGGTETLTRVSADEAAVPLTDWGVLLVTQPDKQQVIYAGPHEDVQIYDYATHRIIGFFAVNAEVGCITAGEELIIIGDATGRLHFLSTENYELIGQADTGQPVTACTFSMDGRFLVTGNDAGEITLRGIKPL